MQPRTTPARRHVIVSVVAMTLLLAAQLAPAAAVPRAPADEPTAIGHGGAVATEDRYASEAAISVLRRGGNAVDAAIAAAAAQGVVRPFSGGIGGGGVMSIYLAEEDRVVTLDHRSEAPGTFGPEAFIDPETGEELPREQRRNSGPAVAVPGAPVAWETALRDYGTMPLRRVLAPAITVASRGFEVDENLARETRQNAERFNDFAPTRELFLTDDGEAPEVGSILRNPDLAATYRQLGRDGSSAFYKGTIADAVVSTVQQPPVAGDSDRQPLAGGLTHDDLAGYEVIERDAVTVDYRGFAVHGMAPPSAGGTTIGHILNLVQPLSLQELDRGEALHYLLEASRVAFADRQAYVADPRLWDVPVQGMVSPDYADQRRALIGETAFDGRVEPGDPFAFDGSVTGEQAPGSADTSDDATIESQLGDTIHLTVSDADGNVVSYTSTIVSIGGNAMVVPGHGFLLNDGLAGRVPSVTPAGEPNAPSPGMRTTSSMSPTIVTDDDGAVLALGSPGGAIITTTVLHTMINYLDLGMTLPEAIEYPRLSQRNTATGNTVAEPAFRGTPEDEELLERGHGIFTSTLQHGMGAVTGVAFLDDGRVQAAAEEWRRGGGSARVERPAG